MSFSPIRAVALALVVAAASLPGCGQQPAGTASKPAIDATGGSASASRPAAGTTVPVVATAAAVPAVAAGGAASRPDSRAAQLALDVPADTRDAVLDGMRSVVQDLMLKGFVADDKPQLTDRLAAIFERAGLGDAPRRTAMATDLATALLDVPIAARKKPGSPLTSDELVGRERVAQALAKDVYARIKPMPTGGAPVHTGVLRAVADQPVPFGYTALSWKTLGGFEYSQGMKLPEPVAKLAGQKVGISGYMMTIDEVENIHSFLLVESLWTCCSGTPPNVNQVIVINIPSKKGVEYSGMPVHVLGTLDVGEKLEDGFVSSVYRLTASSVKVIE